jgi:hypothetical protein
MKGPTEMTSTSTLRDLHRAAYEMKLHDDALHGAVFGLLADATGNADDDYAGQDDVCEEAWSQAALNTLEMLLGSGDAVASSAARQWFIAQGFTF